jgi:vacuolar-type H+-ATPase subunit C/Vma6
MIFGGHYPKDIWVKAIQTRDIMEVFGDSIYHSIILHFESGAPMISIEDSLDKLYYTRMLSCAREGTSSIPDRLFLKFVSNEIDVRNLQTAIKFMSLKRKEKGDSDRSSGLERYANDAFIHGGGGLDLLTYIRLFRSDDMDSMIVVSKGHWFERSLMEMIEQRNDEGFAFHLKDLEKALFEMVNNYSSTYPLSIFPSLSYLLKKRAEVRLIRIIARGKAHGFDNEYIKRFGWLN